MADHTTTNIVTPETMAAALAKCVPGSVQHDMFDAMQQAYERGREYERSVVPDEVTRLKGQVSAMGAKLATCQVAHLVATRREVPERLLQAPSSAEIPDEWAFDPLGRFYHPPPPDLTGVTVRRTGTAQAGAHLATGSGGDPMTDPREDRCPAMSGATWMGYALLWMQGAAIAVPSYAIDGHAFGRAWWLAVATLLVAGIAGRLTAADAGVFRARPTTTDEGE